MFKFFEQFSYPFFVGALLRVFGELRALTPWEGISPSIARLVAAVIPETQESACIHASGTYSSRKNSLEPLTYIIRYVLRTV
jgi:hypothetical protein